MEDYNERIDYLVKKMLLEYETLTPKGYSDLQRHVVLLDIAGKLQRIATARLTKLVQ